MTDGPILFYDADCGFCDSAVRFVLSREQGAVLRFAPLDGETARAAGIGGCRGVKSVVLLEDGQVLVRSRAVRRVLHHMGGRWRWVARGMGAVPALLADGVYRVVAHLRGRLPRLPQCPAPSAEQHQRFLP